MATELSCGVGTGSTLEKSEKESPLLPGMLTSSTADHPRPWSLGTLGSSVALESD